MDKVLVVSVAFVAALLLLQLPLSGYATQSTIKLTAYDRWIEEGKIQLTRCEDPDGDDITNKSITKGYFLKRNNKTYFAKLLDRCVQAGLEEFSCDGKRVVSSVYDCRCRIGTCQNT
tara:strand:- start:42 stop:392 length:351 start_codon:yes stop_codon:yes gene_type:complete